MLPHHSIAVYESIVLGTYTTAELALINQRFRHVIRRGIKRLKREFIETHTFNEGCVRLENGRLLPTQYLSAEHVVPYCDLRNAFLVQHPVIPDNITSADRLAWRLFHEQHAEIRFISERKNRQLGAQSRAGHLHDQRRQGVGG